MRDLGRLSSLARQAGATEREPLPPVEPPQRDSILGTSTNQQDARTRLELQRLGSAYYKDPNKQKRNVFRSKEKKAALIDRSGWTFTRVERFAELDQLVKTGGDVGLAQAILAFEPTEPLNVNARYTSDAAGNSVFVDRPNGWLDLVAGRNDVRFTRLLTIFGANQASKNQALLTALGANCIGTVQELLRSEADPNPGAGQYLMNAVKEQSIDLIRLFLTAIVPIQQSYVDRALISAVGLENAELVALLLAHGANGNYADGQALVDAVSGEHLEDAATILLHCQDVLSLGALNNAAVAACRIGNVLMRQRFVEMLLLTGTDPNLPVIQDQLLAAISTSQREFVDLLISHGTSPDRDDAESLRRAIGLGRIDLVNILLRGPVTESSASRALDEAANLPEADQFEDVVGLLVEKGVSQDSLHRCLAVSVDKACRPTLFTTLIEHGAALDFDDARSLRLALQRNRLDIFPDLLKASCDPKTLGKVLPDAMKIQDPSERYHVMTSLLDKGVSGKELHSALQRTVIEAKVSADYQLMGLLIRNNASVDYFDNNGNCLCAAAARGDGRVLDMLEQGSPSAETASLALGKLPVPFAKSDAAEYEKTNQMLHLLLRNGAVGDPVAKVLVTAVQEDHRGKALDLLLGHNADANYQSGKAVEQAIKLRDLDVLEKLCTYSTLNKATFTTQVPTSLEPEGFDLRKATLFAQTATKAGHKDTLDAPLLQEVQANGSRKEVIELLLGLGASVDHADGEVLRHAVSQGDVVTTRLLLGVKPATTSVARAFPATMRIQDLQTRYALMQSLLSSGGPGMGDEALIQASREANPDDLSHVELLLQHKASPDYKDGASVLESIKVHNLRLLQFFLKSELSKRTLVNAFNLARKMGCSRDQRYAIFSILLQSRCEKFNTSIALVQTVQRDPTDVETSTLLLNHGASVDYQDGQAMQLVASAGSLQLLNILREKNPSKRSREAAFASAIHASLTAEVRNDVYSTLLESGISRDLISEALIVASGAEASDKSLLALLLEYGASLDYGNGSALCNIAARGNVEAVATMLVAPVSQQETLNRSFSACMILEREPREALANRLLGKDPGVSTPVISAYLAQVVRDRDHSLLKLLMAYRPDPGHNNGESLVASAITGDATSTAMLTEAELAEEVLNRAYEALLDNGTIQEEAEGLQTAGLLLERGVRKNLIDRTLLDAFDYTIDQKTKDVVELLIPYKPDFNGDSGKVFVVAACAGERELFRRMAGQRLELDIVILSLISAFQRSSDAWVTDGKVDDDPEPVKDVKVPPAETNSTLHREEEAADADMDVEKHGDHSHQLTEPSEEPVVNGESRKAVGEGDVVNGNETANGNDTANGNETANGDVPTQDVDEVPDADETTNETLKPKMTAETTLISYLRNLDECAERGDRPLADFVIFRAMEAFPEGRLLVKHLMDHGCAANSKVDAEIDASGKLLRLGAKHVEHMTALIWALSRHEPVISEELALEILQRCQNVEPLFETSLSKQSATTIASAAGRSIVLQRLIELDINPSKRDVHARSPSFYASRNGHKEEVELLHSAGARANDGSLQEAARESHFEIVEFLLASGHRADFPSSLHASGTFGRTALEELCLFSAPTENHDEWRERTYQCIKRLLPKKGTDVGKTGSKTMLHLALENASPLTITQVLLDFPAVWENLNLPVHRFRDNGYYYSPTKYVEHFCAGHDPQTRQALISLLKANKCEDRFYAHTVSQPADATGLPDEIALVVDKQNRADHEHREAIKRQQDLSARKRALEAEDHERRLTTDRERHELLLRQQHSREETEAQIAKRKQATACAHEQELASARQAVQLEENRMRQQALNEEIRVRQTMQSNEQAAELSHRQALASQEYQALQQKLGLEKQIANERVSAANREAKVIYEVLEERRSTAQYEASMRAKNAY